MKLDEIGIWSEIKLDIIKEYASAFTTIMKNKAWCKGYVYIDAFAGPDVHISKQTGEFILPIETGLEFSILLGDSRSGSDGNGGWQVPRAEQIRCQSSGQ